MATKAKVKKGLGLIMAVVTVAVLLGLGGRELQRSKPTQTPGMIAVQAMSREGLIQDKVAWQQLLKETHQGRDLTTIDEISRALNSANRHSDAVKEVAAITAVNYPSITKTANYAMINVPGFYSVDRQERQQYIRLLQKQVKLVAKNDGPIVLNFANNLGGDVVPMLAGLAALIPNGNLWAQVDKQGQQRMMTMTTDTIKQPHVTKADQYPATPKLLPRKVFVIMNRHTASSAEMTIIALKQNPHCQILGTDSMGLTSANDLVLLKKNNWAAIITRDSLYSPTAIQGQHHFNNDPLRPGTWTTHVPIIKPSSNNHQQPLEQDFLAEIESQIVG